MKTKNRILWLVIMIITSTTMLTSCSDYEKGHSIERSDKVLVNATWHQIMSDSMKNRLLDFLHVYNKGEITVADTALLKFIFPDFPDSLIKRIPDCYGAYEARKSTCRVNVGICIQRLDLGTLSSTIWHNTKEKITVTILSWDLQETQVDGAENWFPFIEVLYAIPLMLSLVVFKLFSKGHVRQGKTAMCWNICALIGIYFLTATAGIILFTVVLCFSISRLWWKDIGAFLRKSRDEI